jgi:CheY-like chemotaxis protein
MDIRPHIADLAASREQVHDLMAETTTVACFGSRALLSLFVCAAPFPQSVVAAVTTEAEGLDRVRQHRPAFLFATEQLESGNGLSLVRQAHREHPALRTLLILQSASASMLQEALEAGCNGVVVESQLARGAMVDAIRATEDLLGLINTRPTSTAGPVPQGPFEEKYQSATRLPVKNSPPVKTFFGAPERSRKEIEKSMDHQNAIKGVTLLPSPIWGIIRPVRLAKRCSG